MKMNWSFLGCKFCSEYFIFESDEEAETTLAEIELLKIELGLTSRPSYVNYTKA